MIPSNKLSSCLYDTSESLDLLFVWSRGSLSNCFRNVKQQTVLSRQQCHRCTQSNASIKEKILHNYGIQLQHNEALHFWGSCRCRHQTQYCSNITDQSHHVSCTTRSLSKAHYANNCMAEELQRRKCLPAA